LAHANLLQFIIDRDTDLVKDLGLFRRNKMLRPVGIVLVTRNVFLVFSLLGDLALAAFTTEKPDSHTFTIL